MATNNAINLRSAGLVSYDGAGVFSALASPLTVANGGLGVSSLTAYAALCGGTTSTNPVQSIASVGTAGQVLTSNGAGALPTFQTAPAGMGLVYTFGFGTFNPSLGSARTFYWYNTTLGVTGNTSRGDTRFYVPVTGTVTVVYGSITVGGTLGSTETSTIYVRVNATTDYTVTSSLQMSSATNNFSNTGLSIPVTAGDYFEMKWTTPVMATSPTGVRGSMSLLIT